MTRLALLLVALVAGCGSPDKEAQIQHCHNNGYAAWARDGYDVSCVSKINGDDVYLDPSKVTRHRRETGQ